MSGQRSASAVGMACLLRRIGILTLSLGNLKEEAACNNWSGDFPSLLLGAQQITPCQLLTDCCGHKIS